MTNGQSAAFSAPITGTSNTAVTWSKPTIGSISSGGVYTVPMTLTSQQNVTITASSVVDPTKSASATVALIPTITVTLNPSTTQLTGGQSTALNGIVNGTTNTAITWSLSPLVGTVSNGIYIAPSPILSAQTVTVTATSQASTGRTASAVLSLIPVSISVTPATASLSSGQSKTLTATVSGTSNTGVTWTVSPAVGTVSNGVYKAPALVSTAQKVTVKAASVADSSKSATSVISLTPSVSISLTPATASLTSGQSTTLKATVTGSSNTGVSWSMSPSVGTLSNGVYTAPSSIASAQTITVKATSSADPTKSDTSAISLVPPVSVSVTPSSASLKGGQSTTLTATITGSSNTGVSWSMSPSVGTLSNGVYTAPATIASAQTITVKAISSADASKSDTAAISLVPVSISVSPSTASLTGGQSSTLTATVTGTSNSAVNWSMSPSVGTLSNGVYKAPATISSAQTVTVKATSAADATKSDTAAISLVPTAPTVSISVSPSSASLTAGQSTTLTATVTGSSNTSATWSMSPSVGTLSNGVYKAPATISTAQTVTVKATSAADASKSDTAAISLVPTAPTVSISVSPSSASLTGGQSTTLKATVTGSSNTAATWSMSPSVGTLSNGVYKAPATIASAQTVTVKAISAADASKSDTAAISLVPVSITVSPTTASLTGGQSTTIKATIAGSSNAGVTWSMSPSVGTLSNGVYKAPATIASAQTITVKATSSADPTKSSSAAISLVAAAPAISISVTPTAASLTGGQSTTIKATLTGTSNLGVAWTVAPSVGSVANGVYTAPAVISLQQTVTVAAASSADPTKIATAVITLVPTVTVAVLPAATALAPGQSMQFNVSLSGTTNPNVSWTFSPAVGTLSAGLYHAPATINTQQTVTVTAASLADPTKTASATITLVPTIGIALTPSSISLTGGQSTQFSVSINGTPSTAVTWTMAPSVGTLTNGVYTAPVTINTLQTIILTVASIADPTQTATSTITLTNGTPPSTSVSPSTATLSPSQTQQFTADGLGTNPKWAISPNNGSITTGGLYKAPSTILTQTIVTVTATNATDSTQAASATVTLNPAAADQTPPPTTITLPIEVIGPDGTTAAVSFNLPSGANVSGARLWMKIHGLRTETQASLQINSGAWQPISEGTVTLLGLGSAYGGIGGGYHTLPMTIPASSITTGVNTVTFRFNGTDGRVSGFRVLEFNVWDATGNSLIPSSNFVYDDPSSWQPPSTSSSDISAGKTLWRTAPLTIPTTSGHSAIKAHCMDCHAQDGRDLKYFNYSNKSIQARTIFHGLSSEQGDQIASYIRSLNVPNPGRPWNPPYQPGPGLDSQPVDQWSAGAGLDAVLDTDEDMMKALFPTGIQSAFFSPTGKLNIRETQVALQLPDWNSWLPTIHPMDAWSDFAGSELNTRYSKIRSKLHAGDPGSYVDTSGDIKVWGSNYTLFIGPKVNGNHSWTPAYVNQVYSTPLWLMVKNWELNQEFALEAMAPAVFNNPQAEPRAWLSGTAFLTSPNMLHIPRGVAGLDNGSLATWTYLSFIWYHSQLVLNNGEHQQHGNTPIDWQYTYNLIKDLSSTDSGPQTTLLNLWLTKALQVSDNGIGPDTYSYGWSWLINDISREVTPAFKGLWRGITPDIRSAYYNGIVQSWLTSVKQFTPTQFYAGGLDPLKHPKPGQPDSTNFVDRVYYMIPQFRYYGVSQTVIDQLGAWAKTIWPTVNWTAVTTASCTPDSSGTFVRCSTE